MVVAGSFQDALAMPPDSAHCVACALSPKQVSIRCDPSAAKQFQSCYARLELVFLECAQCRSRPRKARRLSGWRTSRWSCTTAQYACCFATLRILTGCIPARIRRKSGCSPLEEPSSVGLSNMRRVRALILVQHGRRSIGFLLPLVRWQDRIQLLDRAACRRENT